ncbi:MAG: aglA [Actinomycetia bacterium]|nr:aglA [Actinomycetes bacterium]
MPWPSGSPVAEWWDEAVFYEVYVRSFADASGDGVGDLPGIRAHLPYIAELGVDALWLTPFYPSPGADHGYDVADYCDVDPAFGTLDDFDGLVADAHELGLRVIVDVVPNHTSIEHPWFREHRERYVWAEGRNGGPPNNWLAVFGGPAWTHDPASGEWYLHLFAPEQPDLDWHQADVQHEFESILRFWIERGVDGFRIDVAHGLFKDPELRDEDEPVPGSEPGSFDRRRAIDQPQLHPLYRHWRTLAGDRVLVGEVFLSDPVRVADYVRPDELQLAFNFTLLWEPWDAAALRDAIDATLGALAAVGATPTWVLENHDVPRLVTRYGSASRARAAALLLLALPGTAFLYAGQELGLEEVALPDEARQDPVFFRTGGARAGRDGCRIPIPWSPDEPGFGFTDAMPWLPVPADWGSLSVATQRDDPASMLSLYRDALRLRPRGGGLTWHESPPGTLVFERGGTVCAVNVDASALAVPQGELLLASDSANRGELPSGTAAWVRA